MTRERLELVSGVGRGPARERRLEEALREKVREAAVRRRRVRVVPHREAEVALGGLAGEIQDVLARTEELHHAEREIGEAQGIGRAAPGEEPLERARIGRRRQPLAELAGELDDPAPALRRF